MSLVTKCIRRRVGLAHSCCAKNRVTRTRALLVLAASAATEWPPAVIHMCLDLLTLRWILEKQVLRIALDGYGFDVSKMQSTGSAASGNVGNWVLVGLNIIIVPRRFNLIVGSELYIWPVSLRISYILGFRFSTGMRWQGTYLDSIM
jgi:hypothetical protein